MQGALPLAAPAVLAPVHAPSPLGVTKRRPLCPGGNDLQTQLLLNEPSFPPRQRSVRPAVRLSGQQRLGWYPHNPVMTQLTDALHSGGVRLRTGHVQT